jgi:hypothetical protein
MNWPGFQVALAGTLLHSLWEGAAVALALAVALCFARSSQVRYGAACVAMVVLPGGLVVTFTHMVPAQPGGVRVAGSSGWTSGAAREFRVGLPPVPFREARPVACPAFCRGGVGSVGSMTRRCDELA